ncbi:MAG TPA: class I SAM-dependent methyltransferase, partial [Acidimicrobiia bacterium]
MVQCLSIDPASRVLELGSGHGVAASHICDRLTTGTYLGVDRSEKMTDSACSRNHRHVASGLASFHTAQVAGLRFDGLFDLILAIHFPPLLRQS